MFFKNFIGKKYKIFKGYIKPSKLKTFQTFKINTLKNTSNCRKNSLLISHSCSSKSLALPKYFGLTLRILLTIHLIAIYIKINIERKSNGKILIKFYF